MSGNTSEISERMDDHVDDHVDDEIRKCFLSENAKNFFMFAGAGSGKTRSLINTLEFLEKEKGEKLFIAAKKIAVITYTNAACDEISERLRNAIGFEVSTIHSFLWKLIENYQMDIKEWIGDSLKEQIDELEEKQRNAKSTTTTTFCNRAEKIERKKARLIKIKDITRFSYNPNGDNIGYDSLNHEEIIKMGSYFIAVKDTMQEVLVGRYPILLIDESQDTKKELVDAILTVCEKHKNKFIVGMFGDTMQRIYTDGKENLERHIPSDWEYPEKIMNHRSSTRIVALANKVRDTIDNQKQQARSDAKKGTARLFIAKANSDREKIEKRASALMAKYAEDDNWEEDGYKSLILEHHMAASRFGFYDLYTPLNESKEFDTALRDGSITELAFLVKIVFPLVEAYKNEDNFEISKIMRLYSPLLGRKQFINNVENQAKLLEDAESALESFMEIWQEGLSPTCLDILKRIKATGVFELNARIDDILEEYVEGESGKITALRNALAVSFDELKNYHKYVTEETRFATHQGVKGLEFPRVMVIMDDEDSRGFLFKYEKIFGAEKRTATDIRNEEEGKDTSIMRTKRLFYVACTRAEESLAVIMYTKDTDVTKQTAISKGWFSEEEICVLP